MPPLRPPSSSRLAVVGPCIKGTVIREAVIWYTQHHGTRDIVRLFYLLPPEVRASLDVRADALGVVASTWYPVSVAHTLLDALGVGMTRAEQAEFARTIARSSVRHTLRGVYRIVFESVTTPERYARNIQRLWGLVHSTGRREITVIEPGRALSRTWEWPGHHPFLCVFTTETMGAIFEAMGCRDVTLDRIGCVSDGDPECRCVVEWR